LEQILRAAMRDAVREVVREELRAAHAVNQAAEILTREQAAELIQVHPAVVTRYVRTRGLPGFKIGRDWRFKRSEVVAWLEASRAKGAA
jgi:excisionase family DNA binding protein